MRVLAVNRALCVSLGWIVVFCLTGSGAASGQKPVFRPNIILMMADDLGWGDVKCFNPETPIKTPNLDAMACAGMKFNRFYSASAACSPTRGSCLTGRHPFRYGVYNANVGYMKAEETTLAELLKAKGYVTGHFGKWHLGTLSRTVKDGNRGGSELAELFSPPQKNGFDVCFSTESKVPTWDPMLRPAVDANANGWDCIQDRSAAVEYGTRYWNEKGEPVADRLEGDDSRIMMDRIIPFIRKATEDETPFFAVIWFHAPHLPVVAGPEYASLYSAYGPLEKNYYGCITAMDEQVGRLRRELGALKIAGNTMIWFCSDNGPMGSAESNPGSAGRFRGRKWSLYEGGVRVPGILEWPAVVNAGSETDFPAVTSDYLPTVMDVLGMEYDDDRPIDGVSLLQVMKGQEAIRPVPIGFQFREQVSLVGQRYKLYRKNGGGDWELYDLLQDPYEQSNIADQHPETVLQMSLRLNEWMKSCKYSDMGKDY